MNPQPVTLRDGSTAILFRGVSDLWACPVCGSVELSCPPYDLEGGGSFEMCSCGFEFGFDDDPGASAQASSSVQENWRRWRAKFLRKFKPQPEALAVVITRLKDIGVQVEESAL